jgi:adenylate cyclase
MTDAAQRPSTALAALDVYSDRLSRATDLEQVVDAALAGIGDLFPSSNALLLVHEPELGKLVTLASHGYEASGTGSEVALGEGVIGLAAARQKTTRIANLQRMLSYARSVNSTTGGGTADEIRLPGLPDARSQLAAPMTSRGVLIGVLAIESNVAIAYDEVDERVLTIAARLVAAAFDREQVALSDHEPPAASIGLVDATPSPSATDRPDATGAPIVLRHYAVDGSTFLGDQYVIKGVAGRLLWKVVSEQVTTGRTSFTNREAKLDKTLELPEYRDNFESRLILLKRRLDEHDAPIRIRSAGRGRFDVELATTVILDFVDVA